MMREINLADLQWTVSGYVPHMWAFNVTMETGVPPTAEVGPVAAKVPGSVQQALRVADLLPDWTVGLRSRECEWVENRHWIFETSLPVGLDGGQIALYCEGLDGNGWIYLNGTRVATFDNAFVPHHIDLTDYIRNADNKLQIVFDLPPRWLGQLGFTSSVRDLKPRFNYTWDWTPRLVQIGIFGQITLTVADGPTWKDARCRTSVDDRGLGQIFFEGRTAEPGACEVRMRLTTAAGELVAEQRVTTDEAAGGVTLDDMDVEMWWPSGMGEQVLYHFDAELIDGDGHPLHRWRRKVGFKSVRWEMCENAPADADPWLCVVNGQAVFLQGINWTPVRPNFADVTDVQRTERLTTYRDLGCNMVRVWGGAFLPPQAFFDACDELGLMVWQDLPLSSSGLDNEPPCDESMVAAMAQVADSWIRRRQHHASLLMWCGGNELMDSSGRPLDESHPVLKRFAELVRLLDPQNRFVMTSSSGPRFMASEKEFGQGVHWDVHGPWKHDGPLDDRWLAYWRRDDALFRSEAGAPGASPVDIIEAHRGDLDPLPATKANPLWQRSLWWLEWQVFLDEFSREPNSLNEYVTWSQRRQAHSIGTMIRFCKQRFPAIGGIILWMGHDAFPCMANTSILDYHGRRKPAADSVAEAFRAGPQPNAKLESDAVLS